MTNKKQILNEEELKEVVGGQIEWYPAYDVMIYTAENGSVTRYKVKNYKAGHSMSCTMHGQDIPEDEIIASLLAAGYIE